MPSLQVSLCQAPGLLASSHIGFPIWVQRGTAGPPPSYNAQLGTLRPTAGSRGPGAHGGSLVMLALRSCPPGPELRRLSESKGPGAHLSTKSWLSICGPYQDSLRLPEFPTTAQRRQPTDLFSSRGSTFPGTTWNSSLMVSFKLLGCFSRWSLCGPRTEGERSARLRCQWPGPLSRPRAGPRAPHVCSWGPSLVPSFLLGTWRLRRLRQPPPPGSPGAAQGDGKEITPSFCKCFLSTYYVHLGSDTG